MASLDQVVAAVSNSISLWEGATQKLLQFCVETGKRAKERFFEHLQGPTDKAGGLYWVVRAAAHGAEAKRQGQGSGATRSGD